MATHKTEKEIAADILIAALQHHGFKVGDSSLTPEAIGKAYQVIFEAVCSKDNLKD
ncbi:MAG: hypothetical protein R8M45_02650 [Ghiorsea sp.]